MSDYRIELGIGLNTQDLNEIKNDIKSLEDKPIRLEIDAETKELTQSIQDALKTLSKGGQNALTIDTSEFKKSINSVRDVVLDLQKTLGSLGDNVNMKDLLSSVNQIANAIGKVTDESETLAKSLSILSKKDFGFNFNLKTGNANPLKAATDYGREASTRAIPAIKEQINYLKKAISVTGDADKALERYLIKQEKGHSGVTLKKSLEKQLLTGYDSDNNKVSKLDRMIAGEQLVDYYKEVATLNNISLDEFNSKFSKSATEIVDDTTKIQTGVKQTEEAVESAVNEIKQMFGGGIGAEQLSAELKPIVDDLHSIQEAITALSKDTSLGGLTASFNRLSESIENLLANAEKVKGVLNSGFDVNGVGGTSASTPSSTSAVKSAQQTGQKIGETVTKSAQQALNLDDVIDEQVKNLMSTYGIKGKKAFEEIKQAVVEYRRELQLANNIDIDDTLGFYGGSADIRKVINALTNNIGRAPNPKKAKLEDLYGRIWDEMRGTKNSGKITIPIKYKYEFPDNNFGDMVRHLPQRFSTKSGGLDFDSWLKSIDDDLRETIINYDKDHISNHIRDHLKNAYDIWSLRGSEPAFLYGDDILKNNDYASIPNEIESTIDAINQKELEFTQISNQTADAASQSQEQIRQEYEKTKQARDEANRQIKEYEQKFKDIEEKNGFVDFGEYQEDFAKWQELENYSDSLTTKMQSLKAQLQGDGISDSFKEVNIAIGNAEDEANSLELALRNIGVSDDNIEKIANQMKEFGVTAKNVKATLGADGDISFKIKGIDDLGRTVTAINSIDIDGNLGEFGRNISQDIDNTAQSFKKLKSLAKEMGDLDIKIAGLEADGKIDEANSLRRVLDGLKSDYQELYLVTEKNLSTDQIKELDQIFANTSGEVREFKQELAEAAKTQELTSGLERLKSIAQEINGLKIELFKAEDTGNIERITNRLNELENESSELRAELQQKFPTASFDQIDDIARKGEEAVAQLVNKVAEAKAKLAQGIKLKISDTGFNGFKQEVLRVRNAAEELEGVYPDLEAALKRLDVAMEDVYSADQAGDVKRLVAANEEYEASLKQVYSQLKLYQQAEKKAYDADILQQKKATLSSEMKSWLKENTRAAKDFGEEIRRLDASLDGLDGKGVKLVGQQFKSITKQAQAMGKTGLTTFDRLKSKAKEYMSYLSAAEIFMYAEQAFRSMFEQVQLIDTAMTELKKVTDETDASYNQFLSNAASRSKELGTTIDGLVSSTADFARLGYSFEESQGLAEVANIYAVVGDEIDGVEGATESLVSTLAAFKDELSGISDTDFAMDIIDKFNEVSNNFSISSGGIGEAMQRSASSLRAANNTIDESIALITAAM